MTSAPPIKGTRTKAARGTEIPSTTAPESMAGGKPTATPPAPTAAPAMAAPKWTVAAVTAAELKALGVDHFFLMSGRDNSLWVAFQQAGIRQVLTRSEAAAVCMADGYARITGRPTFTYGANGPGA